MAGGQTILQYGDVTLYRVVTESVSQVPVFDDSNTDLLYVKTTITVNGYLHGHNGLLTNPTTGTSGWVYQVQNDNLAVDYAGNVGLAEQAVRMRLPPRQVFAMYVGCSGNGNLTDGQLLLLVRPAPLNMIPPGPRARGNISLDNIDLMNGPRNTDFRITQIAGNELFHVTATFELNHLECQYSGSLNVNTYGVLSNRWSSVDSLDTDLQVTRTYTGTLVVASANINIQSFRWLCVPPLQPLFRLDSMNFAVSADGLKLNWTIVHKEVASAAPYPARTWSVVHSEEQSSGIQATSSIEVDLTGDSNVDKSKLITLAYWIIFAKAFGKTPPAIAALANGGADFLKEFFVQSISVTDYAGDKNRITARAHVKRTAQQAANNAMGFGRLGQAITQDNLPDPQPGQVPQAQSYLQSLSWGAYPGQVPDIQGPASLAGVFACYLQTPCNNAHGPYLSGQTTPQVTPDQNPTDAVGDPTVPVPSKVVVVNDLHPPSWYSDSQNVAMYTYWQIDNLYKTKKMRAQMPKAFTPTTSYTNVSTNQFPTSSVVTLAAPQTKRVIRVSSERVGAEPEFPDPDNLPMFPFTSSGNQGGGPQIVQVCLSMKIKPGTPIITCLGQKLFRADAEYVIALVRSPNAGETLALGNDKWTNFGNQSTSPNGTLTNSPW